MRLIICLLVVLSSFSSFTSAANIPVSEKSERAKQMNLPMLKRILKAKNAKLGNHIFIRVFKKESLLEVWVKNNQGKYVLLKDYNICHYSGALGPKLKQGDRQAPEGFYYTSVGRLNPWSQWGLSFNIGYPNAYDRAYQRTGDFIMVHGNCYSLGCFAMRDKNIYEIYPLVEMALRQGQGIVRIHVFPFKMTQNNMRLYQKHRWFPFWQNLKQGYDYFEKHGRPPNVEVKNKRYVFN